MVSAPVKTKEAAQPPMQNAHQQKLIKKYGKDILNGGYTVLPNALLEYQADLKITPQEMNVIIHLWYSWWDHYPYPRVKTIAARMNRSKRAIQYHLHNMRDRKIDKDTGEEIRPKLIDVQERFNEKGQTTNIYDFVPLLELLKWLYKRDHDTRTPVPHEGFSTDPMKVSAGNPVKVFAHNEDESDEDVIDEDTSNLSKLGVGTVEVTESSGYTNRTHNHQQPTDDGFHNVETTSTPKNAVESTTTQNRKIENPPSEGAGGAAQQAHRETKYKSLVALYGKAEKSLPDIFQAYITDFSRELGDDAPKSTMTQVANIYKPLIAQHITSDSFIHLLYDARAAAQKADIDRMTKDARRIKRINYFIELLADSALKTLDNWQKEDAERQGNPYEQ